jgi:amino acid transporter
MDHDSLHSLTPYIPLVIVVVIMLRRTRRPRTIRPERLWIMPVIVVLAIGFYVYGAMKIGPPLHAVDWAVILGTAAVGAALGAARAHMLRLRRHPDTGAIEGTLSAWGLIIILAWIAGRMLLRNSGWVDVNAQFGLYNEASMALVLALVVAQAVVLTQRCQAVRAEYKPSSSDSVPGSTV